MSGAFVLRAGGVGAGANAAHPDSLTPAKAAVTLQRPIRVMAARSPRRPNRRYPMPQLTRRAAFGLVPFALLATRLHAETCAEVLPGLKLCDVWGWGRGPVTDGVLTLTHATGIKATVMLTTGLDEEGEIWARWQQSHAPISARANVLETAFGEIDGRLTVWSAWQPRHVDVPTIVAMTGYVGEGLALAVTTWAEAETYDKIHREAHESLCAAIRLGGPG
jgi:hypothetical protein